MDLTRSERCTPIVRHWNFRLDFYFNQQIEKILQAFQKIELFNFFFFFVDWSITDAKLFFEVPTQQGIMIDETVGLVCVCKCYCWEKFLGNEFGQSLPNQSW